MAADTWLLMQLYWKLDRRDVTARTGWRILAIIAAAVGMLLMGAVSAAAGYFSSFLTRPDMPVNLSPGIVPGFILTFVLIGVLVTGLNQAVRALFLSGDLDRLMVAPVHTRSVMVAKLLSRLPSNVLFLLLIVAPAFFAYGIGLGAGPIYYLLGAILLLLAPLFGLSVGAVLAMLLVRVLPVNRLNELLAAAYAVLGIGIGLAFQIPRIVAGNEGYEQAFESVAGGGLTRYTEALERLPIPTFWAARGLTALDAGRFDANGLLGIGLYVLITLGLFVGLILTADRLYLSGWLKTQSAGGKRRGLESAGGVFGRRSLAATLGWKDWLLRVRDPRQLVTLLGGGFIAVVVGALAIFRGNGGDDSLMSAASSGAIEAPGAWGALTAAFSPGVLMAAWALFVGYVFLSNTASYALALEGGAFPLLKAAPIRPREVWQAKLMSVLVPYVVLFVLALLGARIFVDFSLAWMLYALAAGLIIGYGLLAIGVSTGFRFAKLDWVDPRRMITSGGGLVSLLLTLLYGLPAVIIVLLPFSLAAIWPAWAIPLALVGLLLLGAFTWGCRWTMVRWAESAWDKLPV